MTDQDSSEPSPIHPPFIQIMGGDRTTVYGLTASGDVYQWLGYFGENVWKKLGRAAP